jgi:hypothetical protein
MRIEILKTAMMKQNSACSHCRIKFQKKIKSKNAGRKKESKNFKNRKS